FDAGALQRRLDRDLAELMRGEVGEGPVECADRRARRADDDDVVLHDRTPCLGLAARARCPSPAAAIAPGLRFGLLDLVADRLVSTLDSPGAPGISMGPRLYGPPGAFDPCQYRHGWIGRHAGHKNDSRGDENRLF